MEVTQACKIFVNIEDRFEMTFKSGIEIITD